jgi:hypothetical protein
VAFDHLIPKQLAAALDVVRMLVVPAHPVTLALAPGGLPPGAEDRLDIVEERLTDRPDGDCHRITIA